MPFTVNNKLNKFNKLTYDLLSDFYAKGKVYHDKEYTICIIFTKQFHNNNMIKFQKELIYKRLNTILQLAVAFEYSNHSSNNKLIRCIKFGIFSLYLLCWSYILFVSYNPMLFETYEILTIIQDQIEPFSGLIVNNKTDETNE